jgi:hypothetical protein
MTKFKVALSVFAVAAAFASTQSYPQGSPTGLPNSLNVNVTNTPLPVTVPGGIAVSGNVNVTNVPTVQSQQSGAWNVGINGPVSLASGSSVSAIPQVPAQPFVFYNDLRLLRAFGPAAPSTRLAITSVILTNAHPSDPVHMEVYADGCDGTNKVVYLLPLVSANSTLALSFTSPLVAGSGGTWCLTVTPATFPAPLVPVSIVGYLLP